MKLTLYHYLHCPFCIRVRMALGYLDLAYESKMLNYDDEKTPLDLCGAKMLPIMMIDDQPMNESIDIISKLDTQNRLNTSEFVASHEYKSFVEVINMIGSVVHDLAMPWWIYTKEFTPEAREYFEKKKSVKRGPFSELVKNKDININRAQEVMLEVEKMVHDVNDKNLHIKDIMLASHLWGLYVVPEWQFSP
ncbi:MAG: glutathione S-transferase N-terminal domain-containing protein, partial [Bacteriovoracaceae bacterium]